MRWMIQLSVSVISLLALAGCSLLIERDAAMKSLREGLGEALDRPASSASKTSPREQKIANPLAKTIRFDGNEIVLGRADVTSLSQEKFEAELGGLLEQQRFYSASVLTGQNLDVAERVLWQHWSHRPDGGDIRFVADIHDAHAGRTRSWTELLSVAHGAPQKASDYARLRQGFVEQLQADLPGEAEAERLRNAAQAIPHPLPLIDAIQLMAIRELLHGNLAWAESLFRQASEKALENGSSPRAANLGLMVATTLTRIEDHAAARQQWTQTVQRYCQSVEADATQPAYLGFWLRAHEVRPADAQWPSEVAAFWEPYAKMTGITQHQRMHPEVNLWSGIAHAQLEMGEPQLALVNFKKAEQLATASNQLWLRVAESNCLSALGQDSAAAALLSGPIASDDVRLSAAATAAMGSGKLKAGTYQLGAQLLNKALNSEPGVPWPRRLRAEADLALAKLVIGDTEAGLQALHAVQQRFERNGDISGLLKSLRNEAKIMQLEEQYAQADRITQRIAALERQQQELDWIGL